MNMDDRQARALGPGQLAQPAFVKAKAGMGCLTLRDRTKTGRGIDIEDRHFNQAIPHRKRRPTEHLLIDPEELGQDTRSEEHTSELQSLMRISYAVFCLKKKKTKLKTNTNKTQ